MNFSEPFIRRPVMTAVLTLAVVLFGALAYRALPVSDLPAVDYPVIQVQADYPGASPETMANNVATPLERQFMQINGLELVTSKSTQGHTGLTLQFALSKSIDGAATDVQTAITQAAGTLPTDLPSPPTFSKTNPNDQPLMYIALTTNSVPPGRLYDFASTNVGQQLSILPGVSRVNVFGTKSAIRIQADPSAMAARGISVDDLATAVKNGTSYLGAGQLDGKSGTLLLQPHGQLGDAQGYSDLIVADRAGAPVYLRDVARVRESVQDERVKLSFWVRGYPTPSATVVAAVFRQAGANAVAVADSIRRAMPGIGAQLPPSVRLDIIYDRSRSIVNSVHDVTVTLVIAFVLVVAVIFVFLGRARDTLIPAVALPLSLLLTLMAMRLLGYSLDNLSLMALTLAVGFLVDDAIVFLENTVRRMERGEQALAAALGSAREISFTIVAMTISLAAVFLPLVLMTGLVGRIFREFAVTIVVAIFASGLVSLTLTPLMSARLLAERGAGARRTWMERLVGGAEKRVIAAYGRSLGWFLRRRWISAVVWVICLAGTVLLFRIVPKAFLPPGDSGVVNGVFIGIEGSSPEQMHALQASADRVFQGDPDVRAAVSVTGNSQFVSSNQGLTFIFLGPAGQRAPVQEVAGRLMGKLGAIPGVFPFLRPYPVLEISTGATNQNQGQYAFALSGVDPRQVYDAAGKLMGKLRDYPGFATLSWDLFNHTPSLEIDLRREQARTLGVSEARILALLRNAYAQNYLYLVKKPEDQYQVILEGEDAARSQPDDLALLYIKSDDGKNLVPLRALVSWKPALGPQAVNHLNQFTSVTLFFNLKPGVAIGDATDFITRAAGETVPPVVRASLQGEALTFRDTVDSLTLLMALAAFVMYVILAILYESWIHPLTVLSSLPVALVGGLATLLLFGEQASLYAFIGMFMLMGIVKKNGILIVDFARHRVAAGEPAGKAIHDASIDRFRPILMTTLAALAGALPIAVGFGADGASRRPLGLVVAGGLVVSQLITLYVTPAIYLYLEEFQQKVLDRTSFFRSGRGSQGGGGGEGEAAGVGTPEALPQTAAAARLALPALAVVAMLLGGCAVGPDYRRPPLTVPDGFRGQAPVTAGAGEQGPAGGPGAQTPPAAGPTSGSAAEAASLADQAWWEVFHDPALQALIGEALRNGYDVRIAASRVEAARANAGIARAQFFPQLSAQGQWSRGRQPAVGAVGGVGGVSGAGGAGGVGGAGARTLDLYDVGASASWELDLWGRVRRLNEAARAQYLATEEARRGVLLSLASEVATGYFQLRALDQQLDVACRATAAFGETYDLFDRRLRAGAASALETASAQVALAASAASVPNLERQIEAQENQLALLLGRPPGPIPRGAALAEQVLPLAIPAGLPASLLARRPDLREAEQQLVAANASVGVATANFFPTVSLTAAFGGISPHLAGLFGGGRTWSVGGGLTSPLLQGGRLAAERRVAVAQWEETKARFEQSVTSALSEVGTALVAHAKLAEVEREQVRAVEVNREAVQLSNQRYRAGLSDYLQVLQAEQQQLLAETALAQTRFARLANFVALYRALGGGWRLGDRDWPGPEGVGQGRTRAASEPSRRR